jgi:hypothetical protein
MKKKVFTESRHSFYKSILDDVTHLVTANPNHRLMRRVHCCCEQGEGCIKGLDCCNGSKCDRDVWEVLSLVADHDSIERFKN